MFVSSGCVREFNAHMDTAENLLINERSVF